MKKTTYKDAGVDIDAANTLVEKIGDIVKPTLRPEVMSSIGGFGSVVSLTDTHYQKPVLVSSTDGVGTKLKLAFQTGIHNTVGIDLVAMCVNDVIVQGAEPLFFLDYFATGKLEPGVAEDVVRGIAEGCTQANCSLVGGETAELPGMYADGEYDLAGFSVGIAERDDLIDGSTITVGDKIIGIASSGIHSNGYSLVRKIFLDDGGYSLDHKFDELDKPLGEELLTPTRIYVRTFQNLRRDFSIKGIAHITGGGILENLPRVLPKECQAVISTASWEVQPIFSLMQKIGNVDGDEMLRTFNCGVGMVVVVPGEESAEVLDRINAMGDKAWLIGEIAKKGRSKKTIRLEE